MHFYMDGRVDKTAQRPSKEGNLECSKDWLMVYQSSLLSLDMK